MLEGGALRPPGGIALRPGAVPRHLAFHPDGDPAYVLNEPTPTVTVCRRDAGSGVLAPVAETPVLPGLPAGDACPSGIVASPDGCVVWTATRGADVRPCSRSRATR